MRAKRPLGVLVVLLAIGLLPATAVLATHIPQVADIVVVATNATYNMSCNAGTSEVRCDASGFDLAWDTQATIRPGARDLTSLRTIANVFQTPLDPFFQGWMRAWLAALGVFAAFGAFTVLFWAWFRFRPAPVSEGEG